jgi:hypothetical protein
VPTLPHFCSRKHHAGKIQPPVHALPLALSPTVRPLSTTTFEPVIYDDSSEHKKDNRSVTFIDVPNAAHRH